MNKAVIRLGERASPFGAPIFVHTAQAGIEGPLDVDLMVVTRGDVAGEG